MKSNDGILQGSQPGKLETVLQNYSGAHKTIRARGILPEKGVKCLEKQYLNLPLLQVIRQRGQKGCCGRVSFKVSSRKEQKSASP